MQQVANAPEESRQIVGATGVGGRRVAVAVQARACCKLAMFNSMRDRFCARGGARERFSGGQRTLSLRLAPLHFWHKLHLAAIANQTDHQIYMSAQSQCLFRKD